MKKTWFLSDYRYLFTCAVKILKIMRLTVFIIILSALQTIALNNYAQNQKIELKLTNVTITEALEKIEDITNFFFFYNNKGLPLEKVVSLDLKDKMIDEVLDILFKDTNVSYTINNRQIVLSPGNIPGKAGQQKLSVSGKVTDSSGAPLPGVTVVIKGTNKGIITDPEGNYSLHNVSGDATLVFSFVGMKTREIEILGRTSIDIRMTEENIGLEEVVAVGYGTMKKSSLTGALSQVKAEDLENRTVVRAEDALAGKTAGVQLIQTSGSPSSSSTVRIRGFSSNTSSDPLYVVDGLRVSDIGALDPNNIESIEILKDAASAAIYGMEAGNGVVLITTKTGKKSTNGKISYDFQYTWNSLANVPKVMNAAEYIEFMEEGDLILDSDIETYYDGSTDTKWSDVAFETSLMKKHNINFQAGNDKGNLYVAFSLLDQDGIVTGNSDLYERITTNINADYQIKPWFKMGLTSNMEKWKSKSVTENTEYGSLLSSVLTLDPLTPDVYNSNEIPSHVQNLIDAGKKLVTNEDGQYYGISAFYDAEVVHPMIIRDINDNKSWGYNIMGTFFADLTPIKGLIFTSKLGYRLYMGNTKLYAPDYYINTVRHSDNINIERQTYNGFYYQWENFLNYNFKIDQHDFTVMLGTSFSDSDYDFLRAKGDELSKDLDNFHDISYLSSDATKTVEGYSSYSANLSYFGRISYNYNNKYMLQAILRRDACDSSKLSKDSRWGTFPSVSAGWIISDESFFPGWNNLDQLKIRASWGQNGSTGPLGEYSYTSAILSNTYYPFSADGGYQLGSHPTGIANSDLKWETSEQIDFGFDLHAFNSRLNFTMDYFEKKTKDLLVKIKPPMETGVSSSTVNAGNVKNSGWEFELGWRDEIGKDFKYGINANFATLKNKVTYLDPSISRVNGAEFTSTNKGITAFEVGYPIWYMRGYKLDKIDSDTGNPVFVDVNGDEEVNSSDKTEIGKGIPDFTYGLTLNASYKNFDLIVFGNGSHGNDIYQCLTRSDRPTGNRLKIFYDERWTTTNTNARRPKAAYSSSDYFISSGVIFDGSYFKIKQIQLGYTVPQRVLRRTSFLGKARFYISLEDWFTFTDYPGFDPEAASASDTKGIGVDKGVYPNSRKMVIGFNVTF